MQVLFSGTGGDDGDSGVEKEVVMQVVMFSGNGGDSRSDG